MSSFSVELLAWSRRCRCPPDPAAVLAEAKYNPWTISATRSSSQKSAASGSAEAADEFWAWVAGASWPAEDRFQQVKDEAGFDHYQVRAWRARCPHHLVEPRPGLVSGT